MPEPGASPRWIAALPFWTGPVDVAALHGGLSNESWLVTDTTGKYVVRRGQDYPFHHVFRPREAMTARAAASAGFGPDVVYSEPGIMVSRFIEGRTFAAADVATNIPRIGSLLSRFHREMPAHITGPGFAFWPFHVIRDYAHTLTGTRFAAALPGHLILNAALEDQQIPLPVIFAHNDLLPANFIDDGHNLWLIDFEYAGFSTAMFDLAGVAGNAGLSASQSQNLLAAYFGEPPSPAFTRSHSAMICAALLREALWAQVSALHLTTPGVDFDAYAAENFAKLSAALDAHQSAHGKLP